MTFAYLAGLSLLSAISTERCMSVRCPVWYRCRRPTHLSAIVCAVLWALALLLSTLEGKYCGLLLTSFSHHWCRVFDFIAAGWLIFLCGLLAGSTLALLLRILRKSQRMQLTRLYVTVVLTVLAFLLCGLPYGILWFLLIWIQDDLFASPCHHCLVVFGLSCVNSSVNPIIYFLVGSFRQRQAKRRGRGRGWRTLKAVLQQALEDISELGESESSFPRATLGSGSSLVSGSAWETAFTSMNHTGQAHPQTFNAVTVTLYLLTAVIALGGLAGNAVVLWLLGFHSRRNAFTVYILNLAAADFLCLCCQVIDS
ncbi:hypothetical protein Celaphus_00013551, partial [Cervus elaphus hippelaphus]